MTVEYQITAVIRCDSCNLTGPEMGDEFDCCSTMQILDSMTSELERWSIELGFVHNAEEHFWLCDACAPLRPLGVWCVLCDDGEMTPVPTPDWNLGTRAPGYITDYCGEHAAEGEWHRTWMEDFYDPDGAFLKEWDENYFELVLPVELTSGRITGYFEDPDDLLDAYRAATQERYREAHEVSLGFSDSIDPADFGALEG